MSYDTYEISTQDGEPIELFNFSQESVTWRYTSSESDITVSGNVYTSTSIDCSNIASSNEEARNSVEIIVPRTFAIAELFRTAPPSATIGLIIQRVHRGDLTSVVAPWTGRVVSCKFEGASAKLLCDPISVSLKRTGLRRLYGRACPYVLYGHGCGLAKASFDHATTVSAIAANVLTVASVDGAFSYAGGFVEFVLASGVTDRRFILSQSGSDLTLMSAFQDIAVTDDVVIYPGCDHTLTTCNSVFSNAVNYGGFPFFPTNNPFVSQVT